MWVCSTSDLLATMARVRAGVNVGGATLVPVCAFIYGRDLSPDTFARLGIPPSPHASASGECYRFTSKVDKMVQYYTEDADHFTWIVVGGLPPIDSIDIHASILVCGANTNFAAHEVAPAAKIDHASLGLMRTYVKAKSFIFDITNDGKSAAARGSSSGKKALNCHINYSNSRVVPMAVCAVCSLPALWGVSPNTCIRAAPSFLQIYPQEVAAVSNISGVDLRPGEVICAGCLMDWEVVDRNLVFTRIEAMGMSLPGFLRAEFVEYATPHVEAYTRLRPYLGLPCSACSDIGRPLRAGNYILVTNKKYLDNLIDFYKPLGTEVVCIVD